MIKRLDRYIMSSVLGMTALIFFIFLGLALLIGLSSQASEVGQGAYTFVESLKYTFLMLPLNLYWLSPNIALLGTLLGLGALASHSELTVMRTSGFSVVRIAWSVFCAAILIVGVFMLIGEYLAPDLAFQAEKNKAYLKKNGQVIATERGIWLRQNQYFIHINTSYDRKALQDITRYELDPDFHLVRIAHADEAKLQGHNWLMKHVVTTQIKPEKIELATEQEAIWDISVDLSDMSLSPQTLSFKKLYKQAQMRVDNGVDASVFWLAFWSRLFQPLATLMMVFLALPFAFGPLRSAAVGLRLLSGVMIGLAFFVVNRFVGPFILAYQLPPILVAVLPFVLFACLMVFLARRGK